VVDIPILKTIREWYCPNCHLQDRTMDPRPHTRFHACPSLYGMTAPMLPVGTRASVTAVERQDYVGSELVQTDSRGRPVMSVVTTRDNGQDTIVFAPTATARAEPSHRMT
jgi:hypothetical protein